MQKNTNLIPSDNKNLSGNNKLFDFNDFPITDVIDMYLMPLNSEQTQRAYKGDLMGFFQYCQISYLSDLKNYAPVSMTKMFFSFLETFAKRQPHRKDLILNPKTINRKAYSISGFFNYIIATFNYPFNPTKTFKQLEVSKKSTTESLNKTEVMLILEKMKSKSNNNEKDLRNYLLFLFMASMALRRNELVNIKWSDIDLTSCIVTIFQKGRTIKKLPIPVQIMEPLLKFKSEYFNKSDYLFRPTSNNRNNNIIDKPITADMIFKLVKDTAMEILPNRKNISPHSFRKAFIEISLDARIDISSIRNATGHCNLDALRYYDGRNEIANNAVNLFFES